MNLSLPDQRARDRIRTALDTNILVEAGAGSGKTTALVDRMVALVGDHGVEVEQVAAVTFTRKAAGELRERFQGALEKARRKAEADSPQRARLEASLGSVDRAFMGTIHAFCARLLRERPLEAGLDPAFGELTAQQSLGLATRWWNVWLERLAADGDPVLDALDELGIRPDQLQHTFAQLTEYSDVDFPAPTEARPDPSEILAVRRELDELMDRADGIFPDQEPDRGWGELQQSLKTAWFYRRAMDWDDERVVMEAIRLVLAKADKVTLSRWFPERKDQGPIKDLRDDFRAWAAEGGRADRLVRRWLAHCYPVCLGFAQRAARDFARFRKRTGQLSFHDLLALTADLLRRSPQARRDLGTRYRYLLVDEFQDTDPLQAEVLFLLASDPDEGDEGDWRRSVPRPGALFVVGDPKQSIYRFRRADIALYQQVRERFDPASGGFGAVVRLTANFRSLAPVGALVNDVFADPDRFPADPTPQQAPFAPLEPQRTDAHQGGGVYVYDIPPCQDPDVSGRGREKPERDTEATALARWIARRVDDGERTPGDFLLLTRTKRALDTYARALEARNLPVEVSGAGVGIEEELAELEAVLRALSDPDDVVLTVAALTGLFFGLDLEQLLRRQEERQRTLGHPGGAFDFRQVPPRTADDYGAASREAPVEAALGTLHRWWRRAQAEASDVVVAEIVDELGLLPWAAAGELGQIRAGALAFALDAVRGAGLDGDTSLVGALEALQTALAEEESEAPLEPERPQAIRLMNLHKAKGLEGAVVVLADPYEPGGFDTRLLVERDPAGGVRGWLRVGEPGAWNSFHALAQPLSWPDKEEAEQRFADAEETRLLYVAATRACDELVVTRCGDPKRAPRSPWCAFHAWLDQNGHALELEAEPPPPRDRLHTTAAEIGRRVDFIRARREAAAAPGYAFDTVTGRVHHDDAATLAADAEAPSAESLGVDETGLTYDLAEADSSGPGGFEWGSAVHAVLEAAARGVEGEALAAAARTALLEQDRPARDGEPTELATLLALVDAVRASELWEQAEAAGEAGLRLAEHPFALEMEDGSFLEGVIDLAFTSPDGWTVVDYKTDRGDDPELEARVARYHRQLDLYADALERLTGRPVAAKRLWFLRPRSTEP